MGLTPKKATPQRPNLTAEDVRALERAFALLDRHGERVWPGLSGFRCPVVYLVEDGQFLLGAVRAPDYYRRWTGAVPAWADGAAWIADGRRDERGRPLAERTRHVHLAFERGQTGGHYDQGFVFQDSVALARAKSGQGVERWLEQFWHEAFHVFQSERGLSKGDKPNLIAGRLPSAQAERYRGALEAERKALAEALVAPSLEAARARVREGFLARRAARYASLAPEFVECELLYEASEGTALYVERLLAQRERPGARDEPDHAERPLPKGQVHLFAYALGAAQARALDALTPGWKAAAFGEPRRLYGLLARACAE